jgi:PAS domain-containing protein
MNTSIKENKKPGTEWIVEMRWVLFIWMAGVIYLHLLPEDFVFGAVLLVMFAVTQLAATALKNRIKKTVYLHNAVFLMDINFVLAALWTTGQLSSELSIAFFLTLFAAALAKKTSFSFIIAGVIAAIYLYLNSGKAEIWGWEQAKRLAEMPFIFVMALHASVLAEKSIQQAAENKSLWQAKTKLTEKCQSRNRQLVTEEHLMSQLLDTMGQPVLLLDQNQNVQGFSREATELFGLNAFDVLGLPLGQFDSLKELQVYLGDTVNEKTPFIFLDADGRDRWAEVKVCPLLNPGTGEKEYQVVLIQKLGCFPVKENAQEKAVLRSVPNLTFASN